MISTYDADLGDVFDVAAVRDRKGLAIEELRYRDSTGDDVTDRVYFACTMGSNRCESTQLNQDWWTLWLRAASRIEPTQRTSRTLPNFY